jgi:translation elongation factor EF-1beta
MGRRSKVAASISDEIKSQQRRPRKKREVREIPFGLQAGQLVVVSNDRDFKGNHLHVNMTEG